MKKIFFTILILASLNSWGTHQIQGPEDGPVNPWPLELGRQPIDLNSFGGTWFAPEENDQWVLTITPWQEGRSYHWELYLRSSPALRSEGIVHLRDQYVIGLVQSPFVEKEFILMYLTDGKLHLKIGGGQAPRAEALFVRRSNEI